MFAPPPGAAFSLEEDEAMGCTDAPTGAFAVGGDKIAMWISTWCSMPPRPPFASSPLRSMPFSGAWKARCGGGEGGL